MALLANAELVAINWIKGVTGVPVNQVNTVVPATSESFAQNGFIQVQSVGGTPDEDTFMQNSIIQVDTWAYSANSNKAPWGHAYNLAMLVKEGLKDAPRLVTLPSSHNDAFVHEVRVLTDARRFGGDEANFARYSMDLHFHWTERVKV